MLWQTTKAHLDLWLFRGRECSSLCGFLIFLILNSEDLKELRYCFLFITMKKKSWKKSNSPSLLHLFALCADWTLVALTTSFFFKCLLRIGDKEGEKERDRNLKNRRILMKMQSCLQFQNSPTADSWMHFNFSLITHLFFNSKELIIYLCEVPYAMRSFKISSRYSPIHQQY